MEATGEKFVSIVDSQERHLVFTYQFPRHHFLATSDSSFSSPPSDLEDLPMSDSFNEDVLDQEQELFTSLDNYQLDNNEEHATNAVPRRSFNEHARLFAMLPEDTLATATTDVPDQSFDYWSEMQNDYTESSGYENATFDPFTYQQPGDNTVMTQVHQLSPMMHSVLTPLYHPHPQVQHQTGQLLERSPVPERLSPMMPSPLMASALTPLNQTQPQYQDERRQLLERGHAHAFGLNQHQDQFPYHYDPPHYSTLGNFTHEPMPITISPSGDPVYGQVQNVAYGQIHSPAYGQLQNPTSTTLPEMSLQIPTLKRKASSLSTTSSNPSKTPKTSPTLRRSSSAPKTRRSSTTPTTPNPNDFPCLLKPYGCTSIFTTKNEWKRHITTQHICQYAYHCRLCGDNEVRPNIFNRKDLFTAHLKRMHLSKVPSAPLYVSDDGTELEPAAVYETCIFTQHEPPTNVQCIFCHQTLVDKPPGEWLEHIGKHLEDIVKSRNVVAGGENTTAIAADQSGDFSARFATDTLYREWLVREGFLVQTDDGWVMADSTKRLGGGKRASVRKSEDDGEGDEE